MLIWLLITIVCPIIAADKKLHEKQVARADAVSKFNTQFAYPNEKIVRYSKASSGSSDGVVFGMTTDYAYGVGHNKKECKLYRFSLFPLRVIDKIQIPLEAEMKPDAEWTWYSDEDRYLGCCEIKYGNNITFVGYSPTSTIVVRALSAPWHRCRVEKNSIICEQSNKGIEWVTFLTIKNTGVYNINDQLIKDIDWTLLEFKQTKQKSKQ